MDEESGKEILEQIWKQAKQGNGIITLKEFIYYNTNQIRRMNKGYWVLYDAKSYIEDLQKHLP